MGEKSPEELTDGEIFYDLDRYPKMGMTAERDLRSADQGYLTMVSYKNKVFTYKIGNPESRSLISNFKRLDHCHVNPLDQGYLTTRSESEKMCSPSH